MSQSLVRSKPSLLARVANVFTAFTRATLNTNGTSGWSIVRGSTPSDFQGSGAEVRRIGWEKHPVVQACIRAIVDLVAAVPLEVYRKTGDDTIVDPKHPALALFRGEGGRQSEYRLKARTGTHFMNYGNAFWILERHGLAGPPKRLRVISPEAIQYVWLDPTNDLIRAYDWRDLNSRAHPNEPAENVIHFRDLDAGDGLFGYPRMASALRSILSDTEASEYVRQIVTNHGTPGLAVLVDAPATQGELTAAEEKWKEKWVTRGNRGATAFLSGVKGLEQIGFSLNDLEFPDLRAVTREDICTAANVDPRIIGIASASSDGGLSGQQYAEARFRLIQQSVYPVMRALEDELNWWLMPEYGDVYVRFSEEYIAAITEDIDKTSTRVLGEVTAKVRTVEEAREAIGLDADMDPKHTLPGGMTVKDSADNAKSMADATLEATKNPKPAAGPPARSLVRAAASPVWESFDERARKEEAAFVRAALEQFGADARTIDALARRAATDQAFADEIVTLLASYTIGGAVHEAWVTRFQPLVARVVEKGAELVSSDVGIRFDLENPRVRAIIRARAGDLVTNVTETTRESIRAALELGRAQGFGVSQIAKLIRESTFGEITKSRALTIARTETVGAMNAGEYQAAVQSGVMRSKTWLTSKDDRVRDGHAAQDEQTVDIEAAFRNGMLHPHQPGAPASEVVNCRCTLLFSDQEAGRS